MTTADFENASVRALLDDLSSARPAPGGGTGAAVAGAIGAALVAMLARVTLTSPRYASHHRLMQALAEGADETARRLLGLARTDAAAYAAVTAARGLPRRTEAERARRSAEVQKALKGAVEVPLQVMEQCAQAIGLAKNAVECGSRNAASDGATGAELCRAALKAAAYSVQANLASIEDETYVKISRTRMDEMLYMGTRVATNVESYVNDLWK